MQWFTASVPTLRTRVRSLYQGGKPDKIIHYCSETVGCSDKCWSLCSMILDELYQRYVEIIFHFLQPAGNVEIIENILWTETASYMRNYWYMKSDQFEVGIYSGWVFFPFLWGLMVTCKVSVKLNQEDSKLLGFPLCKSDSQSNLPRLHLTSWILNLISSFDFQHLETNLILKEIYFIYENTWVHELQP